MAISDTIQSMYENVGEVYDTITNVDLPTNKNIANIPRTIKDSYLEIMNNGIDVVWNNWEKVNATGQSLTLTPTEEAPMKMIPKGNTSQVQYSGKQLIPYDLADIKTSNQHGTWSDNKFTYNGITFEFNDDGSVKATGSTSSSNAYVRVCNAVSLNGSLTLSSGLGTSTNYYARALDRNNGYATLMRTDTSSDTATINTSVQVVLYIKSDLSNINVLFKPMIRLSSVSDDTYEPYVGSTSTNITPSPNPDYPQIIHSVSGDNEINIQTRNLLPTDKTLWESGHYNTNGDKSAFATRMRTINLIPCLPNTNYYVLGSNFYIREFNSNKTFINNAGTVYSTNTFTTGENTYYLGISVEITYSDYIEETNKIAIFYNSETDKTWAKGILNTYHITLPNGMELNKIGNYQDKIVKTDKWYWYREIGECLIKCLNVVGISLEDNGARLNYTLPSLPINSYPNLYCKYFRKANNYNQVVNTGGDTPNLIGCNTSGAILCNVIGYTTKQEYYDLFDNNDIYVYYPLKTPTYTEITDSTLISQLEAIYNAKSKEGTTNISQVNYDLPFELDATALKKTN